MSVVEAVRRDLDALGSGFAEGALAATALALAARIDDPGTSSTSVSMCAKALTDTLEQLRALAPPREEADTVDEIAARRAARRDRRAASTD